MRLEKVAKQYPETTLGQWCAARVGLEYYGQFIRNRRSAEKDAELTADDDALLGRAYEQFEVAAKIRDDFPVREEVVYCLASIECGREDYENAAFHLDELELKYPKSRYSDEVKLLRVYMKAKLEQSGK